MGYVWDQFEGHGFNKAVRAPIKWNPTTGLGTCSVNLFNP